MQQQAAKNFSLANVAAEINSGVKDDLLQARKTIVMAIPDIQALQVQYHEWGEAFKMEKTIKGRTLVDWVQHFHIEIKQDADNDLLTPEWTRIKIIEIHDKLKEAMNYHRTAKLKYNEIITDGAVRYLSQYEAMIDPNNEDDAGAILSRNVSKEKIKMIAEAKNKNVIAAAMIAQEETEFFQSIIDSLNQSFFTLRMINNTIGQDIKLGSYGD